MNRLACCFVLLMTVASSASAGSTVNLTVGNDVPYAPYERGNVTYDGRGGHLSGVDIGLASRTYWPDRPLSYLDYVNPPYPGTAVDLPFGRIDFTTGNLLRIDGDSLVFAPGGTIILSGAIGYPGAHNAVTADFYVGTFTQNVVITSTGGKLKIVTGAIVGYISDVFSKVYDKNESRTYNANLSLTFITSYDLAHGFDTPVVGGNSVIDISPTPEPASLAMFCIGITGIAVYRRLRSR